MSVEYWKLSPYTAVIPHSEGILLHNSFMGAVFHVGKNDIDRLNSYLKDGIQEKDLESKSFPTTMSRKIFCC